MNKRELDITRQAFSMGRYGGVSVCFGVEAENSNVPLAIFFFCCFLSKFDYFDTHLVRYRSHLLMARDRLVAA